MPTRMRRRRPARNGSDLTQGRLHGQGSQALVERIEVLCHPGTKETGQSHAGLGAFGTTSAHTVFASHDQGANAALGQIVVGGHTTNGYKDKEFRQEALHSFT